MQLTDSTSALTAQFSNPVGLQASESQSNRKKERKTVREEERKKERLVETKKIQGRGRDNQRGVSRQKLRLDRIKKDTMFPGR